MMDLLPVTKRIESEGIEKDQRQLGRIDKLLEEFFKEVVEQVNDGKKLRVALGLSSSFIKKNKARCNKCGDIVESTSRWSYVACKCGSIAVDGGNSYLRRCYVNPSDITELSEVVEVDNR